MKIGTETVRPTSCVKFGYGLYHTQVKRHEEDSNRNRHTSDNCYILQYFSRELLGPRYFRIFPYVKSVSVFLKI